MSDTLRQLEQSVIGAVIIKPETLSLLPTLESADFLGVESRFTWNAIRNLEAVNAPIDLTTISDELGKMGKTDGRWIAFLGICAATVPTVDNAIEYARRIKSHSLRKRVLESMADVIATAQRDSDLTGEDVLTMALQRVSAFDAEQPDNASTVGQIVQRRLKELERIEQERMNGGLDMTGFPTGVTRLDEKLGGWQPGIVSIVAARPAMGKSSLGLATADACSKRGIGVHLFSLEDSEGAYADRAMSRLSQVPAEKIRRLSLDRGQMGNLQDAMRVLGRRQGWLFDGRSGITADEIVRSVRRRKRDNKTKVAIVDYIQLVKKPHPRMSAHEALSEIITTLADAAKQDAIAYVVMSQLNRGIESREDKRPQESDLRESGSLEERSKCIVGIYRGAKYGGPQRGIDYDCECEEGTKQHSCRPPSDEEFERQVQLLILKNSNGQTGKVTAQWTGPTTTIE